MSSVKFSVGTAEDNITGDGIERREEKCERRGQGAMQTRRRREEASAATRRLMIARKAHFGGLISVEMRC